MQQSDISTMLDGTFKNIYTQLFSDFSKVAGYCSGNDSVKEMIYIILSEDSPTNKVFIKDLFIARFQQLGFCCNKNSPSLFSDLVKYITEYSKEIPDILRGEIK